MFVRTVTKRSVTALGTGILLTAVGVLLLAYPDAVSTGISRGMAVCTTVVIPTLYPFMLLAGLLTDSSLCRYPGRFSCWLTGRLFGLPGCCGPAILLGLVGGYPAGMLAAARLYRQGSITPEQWRRMSAFCVGAGPGFIVGTIGTGLLGSARAGVLLYAAQTAASLGIGIWLGRGHRRQTATAPAPPPQRPMAEMVADSCRALLTMCGFVVAAAMVLSLTEAIGLARMVAQATGWDAAGVSAGLAGILEVSCGCMAAAGMPAATVWLSLMLSWGGLSVQGQLAAALPEQRLLTPRFWGWRIVHGAVSSGVALLLFRLFPVSLQTVGGAPSAIPYSVSAQGSVMLLFLTFLAMLYFSQKKTGNAG